MSKKLIIIFSMLIGILIFSNTSYASSNYLPPSNDKTDVVYVSENVVVLIDYANNKADLVELTTNMITNISNDANTILDLNVMKNPQKIVLLKKDNGTTISKTVLSYKGTVISKAKIALKNTGNKIKWVAPTGTVNERIMVQSNNSFNLYQYPWSKPNVSYNATIIDKGYEFVNVQDWDFVGYPDLAIKYQAQGIMSDDFFVKTVNLYTKKVQLIKDFNTDINLKYNGGNLALFTSYTYQATPANASRPIATESQKVYRLINTVSGVEIASLKDIYKEEGDISGWQTELINDQVFVGNLLKHTWSLYSQKGSQILANQTWPKESTSKFLSYNSSVKTAYFLDYASGQASITSYSIQ
ncbi:hypothetical protein [Paenibacillus monticola]|uniref:Copper amine oxidase-like N-terminal domain-containing protein n=1 Tax=Paenibacillus monticola TaxID=2666075 RepID=A0A7X2H5Z7_9BACL|nr:hypothetical protein [Paenibacillus monticola]MRN54139.1 hypothetical protein [Paenibacillus monticola]